MSLSKLERRRERIEALLRAGPSRSNRDIAREVGCSHMTVGRLRADLAGQLSTSNEPDTAANGQHPGSENLIAPAGEGNLRAGKHLAYSETRLAPLRVALEASLRDEFGVFIDARRLWLAADLLARVEAARSWLDDRGGVVRNKAGEVYPVVDRVDRWGARADALLRDFHEAKREAEAVDPMDALGEHLRSLCTSVCGDPRFGARASLTCTITTPVLSRAGLMPKVPKRLGKLPGPPVHGKRVGTGSSAGLTLARRMIGRG